MDVEDSLLAQLWLGQDLQGEFSVIDSLVLQAWNGSPEMCAQLKVGSKGEVCRYHGLVGFTAGPEHVPLLENEQIIDLDRVDPNLEIRRLAVGMDYRRNASEREVDLDLLVVTEEDRG